MQTAKETGLIPTIFSPIRYTITDLFEYHLEEISLTIIPPAPAEWLWSEGEWLLLMKT